MTSWIWWAVATFGIGGVILGALIFMGLWPAIVGTKIGRLALMVTAGALAVFGIYLKGRAEGRAAERARLKALTAKEVANAAKERARIDALTDAQVDAELAKWDRKP